MVLFDKQNTVHVYIGHIVLRLCMGGRAHGDTEPIKRKPKSLAIPVWDIILMSGEPRNSLFLCHSPACGFDINSFLRLFFSFAVLMDSIENCLCGTN